MSGWAEVDRYRRERMAEHQARLVAAADERAARAPYRFHLSREWPPYFVTMKRGGVRRFRAAEVYRLGASTRSRLVLHALCGDLAARGDIHQRLTVKRGRVQCDGCLVLLDEAMETGAAFIDGSGTVVWRQPLAAPTKRPSPQPEAPTPAPR